MPFVSTPSGLRNHDAHIWIRHGRFGIPCWHWHIYRQCSLGYSLNIPHSTNILTRANTLRTGRDRSRIADMYEVSTPKMRSQGSGGWQRRPQKRMWSSHPATCDRRSQSKGPLQQCVMCNEGTMEAKAVAATAQRGTFPCPLPLVHHEDEGTSLRERGFSGTCPR